MIDEFGYGEFNPEPGGNLDFMFAIENFDEYCNNIFTYNENNNDYFKVQEKRFNDMNDDKYGEENIENQVGVNAPIPLDEEKIFAKKGLTEINKSSLKTSSSTKFSKDGPIFKISKEFKENLVGRKRKNNVGGKHSKFSYDNVTRKFKTKFFDSLLTFLNASLISVQIENPKKYSKKILYSKPFFLKIDQEIIKDINVEPNQNLIKSTLKEIFSNNVSKKVENYGLDYNKNLIEKIYSEKIQKKTIDILEKTFLECLEQFRGSKQYSELEGLEKEYKNVINGLKENGETDEYIEIFKDFVGRFEEYYGNKKGRPPKKKNEEN